MLKLTFCLHRLPGMSREDFQDYWYNQHGPLVARLAKRLWASSDMSRAMRLSIRSMMQRGKAEARRKAMTGLLSSGLKAGRVCLRRLMIRPRQRRETRFWKTRRRSSI